MADEKKNMILGVDLGATPKSPPPSQGISQNNPLDLRDTTFLSFTTSSS